MDGNTSKLLGQLLEVGCKKNIADLEKFVNDKFTAASIKLMIHTVFTSSKAKASQVILYLLKGLANSNEGDKRLEAIKQILKEMKTTGCKISKTAREDIIGRITMTVDKFSPEELVTLTDVCVANVQLSDDAQMCWKELLPKLLNVLSETEEVVHSGTPMTGAAYKSHVVQALCMATWNDDILTPLAIMFTDMALPQEEHVQLVNKFCACFADGLAPNELVTLVQHLLILCKDRNAVPVFFALQAYFTRWIYDDAPDPMDMNSIEVDHRGDAPAAEASIRLWIYESASHGHTSVKDLLKCVKNLSFCPEKFFEPFLLTLLLSLTHIPAMKAGVVDTLRSAVIRLVVEQQKRETSAWLASLTPDECDVAAVLTRVVTHGHECEKVMNGVIALAFALLNVSVSPSMKEHVAEQIWCLGQSVLVQAVKKKTKEIGCGVVEDMYNSIKNQQAVKQLIACTAEVLRARPHVIRDRSGPTVSMMQHVSRMSVAHGVDMIKALLPVIRNNSALTDSTALRENLIIILRKDLISHTLNTRLIAVSSFLHVLSYLEITSMAAISQTSSSQSATGRQATQRVAGLSSNESICLDLLRVLGRVFGQQAEVRLALYNGLGKCVTKNPELLSYVHDMLLGHVRQYYVEDEDTLPPLEFAMVAPLQDVTAVLKEPLAHLVLAMHHVVTQTDDTTLSGVKLAAILDSLTDRMAQCDLEHLNLMDASELVDNLPEGCQKREVTIQALGVYESLMSYVLATWTTQTDEHANKLVALFNGYNRLVEFCKSVGKAKKLEANDTTRPGKAKKGKAEPRRVSVKQTVFKFPPTLHDFPTACQMMKLIFEETVDWSTEAAANQVKGERELRKYAVQVALELVKQSEAAKEQSVGHFGVLIQLGKVLFQRIVCRLQEECEYDLATALLAVECFGELLMLVGNTYTAKMGDFLLEVVGPRRTGSCNSLLQMITVFRDLIVESVKSEVGNDPEPGAKKIAQYLVSCFTFLVNQLPSPGEDIDQLLDWVKEFVADTKVVNDLVATGMLQLLLDLHKRCKVVGPLYDHVALQLRKSYGVVESEGNVTYNEKFTSLAMISKATRNASLQMMCAAVKQSLAEVDWMVNRLRSEYAATALLPSAAGMPQSLSALKAKERGVCTHLSHSIKLVNLILTVDYPSNLPQLETVMLRLLISLYTQLGYLTRYFMHRSTKINPIFQAARFDSLVTLCGKHLSLSVQTFVNNILNRGVDDNDGRKKNDASLMREKNRVLREEKILPQVTFQKEQFEKFLIKLSTKTKVNLMEHVKVNGGRDFRLKKGLLQNVAENHDTSSNVSVTGGEKEDEENQPKRKKQRQS